MKFLAPKPVPTYPPLTIELTHNELAAIAMFVGGSVKAERLNAYSNAVRRANIEDAEQFNSILTRLLSEIDDYMEW